MKARRKNINAESLPEGVTFEQAIQELEQIVSDMEAAELPLDDVLNKYERGSRLVRFCTQKLDEAEKKIELLTKKADGSTKLEPFEQTESEDDSEGKLF